jgi:signal recognition particle subunit SEC65
MSASDSPSPSYAVADAPADAAAEAARLNAALGRGMMSSPSGSGAAAGGRLLPPYARSHIVVWPIYLEASAKVSDGRRIPRAAAAGCDAINVYDIAEAAVALGFKVSNIVIEMKKRYPRAAFPVSFTNPGRVRINLKDGPDEDSKCPAGVKTKETLLRALARVIPTLESRHKRNAQIAAQQEAMRQQQQQMMLQQQQQQQLLLQRQQQEQQEQQKMERAPPAGAGKGKKGKK